MHSWKQQMPTGSSVVVEVVLVVGSSVVVVGHSQQVKRRSPSFAPMQGTDGVEHVPQGATVRLKISTQLPLWHSTTQKTGLAASNCVAVSKQKPPCKKPFGQGQGSPSTRGSSSQFPLGSVAHSPQHVQQPSHTRP
jgi:hypothetical protein